MVERILNKMKINFNNVIENDFEEEIYKSYENKIINYLKEYGETSFWDIIRNVGGSERRMIRLLNEMINIGEISFNGKNKFYIKTNSSENYIHNCICKECNGKRVNIGIFNTILKDLEIIWNNKPNATFYFDQRPVTLNTTLRRVAYLMSNGDIKGKKIIMLGDDDLTSVALALLKLDCEVFALDADERLIKYINKISKEYNLNLKGMVYNALDKTNNELMNKFDVLMTDPTPEKIPFTLFMNRAIELTKGEGSIIYTSIYSSAMKKTLDLQKIITDMNLYITDIIPKFTEYQSIMELYSPSDIELFKKYGVHFDNESICFTESLFRMEVTETTRKLKIKYKGSDIFGKATKRAIKDNKNDVQANSNDMEYLMNVEKNLKENSEKYYESE